LKKREKHKFTPVVEAPYTVTRRQKVENSRPAVGRLKIIDAMRGVAIVLMIAYHFSFDLNFFGVLRADFNRDVFWLGSRALIVTLFVSLVGVSLALSVERHAGRAAFWKRQARIGACALLVSMASWWMFPRTFIFFGILHFIFAASLAGGALLRVATPSAVFALLGAVALLGGIFFSSLLFDAAPMQWIGFMTRKPPTEDYVPLFPWIGVVFFGIAAGQVAIRSPLASAWLAAKDRFALPPLAWMGRHSLAIYMLHQPVLLGLLFLFLGK
jgi:uncharacterized membrane protein